jgi:hypothetical protein
MDVDKDKSKEQETYNDSTSSNYSFEDDEEDKKIIREKSDEITFDFTKKKRKRLCKKYK